MDTFWGVVLGLFILVMLVVLHELGHAIAARRNGVVVEEFGIGFPPKAWSRRLKNGVLFSLNWLPLGGFVKLQGEHDDASKKGDYGAASFWVKTKILFAGVTINWITAALLFTLLALIGMPRILENQFIVPTDSSSSYGKVTITNVESEYPAEKSGIMAGDQIISLAGQEISDTDQFIELTKQYKGQTVPVVYNREGKDYSSEVSLRSEGESAYFGAGLDMRETLRSTWSAPIVGIGVTVQLTVETVKGLGSLIGNLTSGLIMKLSPSASDQSIADQKLNEVSQGVAGPVGILGVIFPQAGKGGFTIIILLTAIISLTLAVMNALPIPSLDGGRWFVTALFKILKKPLTKSREEKIHGTGFMLLMFLIIIITIGDVAKLFG